MLEGKRRTLSRTMTRLQDDGLGGVSWSLRVTVAATASYVVGILLFPGTQPLLAALTAMLVVQVTPVSLLASGVDRVLAVVAGVALAVVIGALVPLRWWSLGILILAATLLAQALRLKDNRLEVAISGMLVLGVGALSQSTEAWQRVTQTLVGAAVAVAANLLFPPKIASANVGDAIDEFADRIGELLTRAADEMDGAVSDPAAIAPLARGWLGEARSINSDIPLIAKALLQAEEARKLNVRAVATADVGPGLRQGLESLEHAALTIRGTLRAVLDATREVGWLDEAELSADDVFVPIAQTFRELAAGVDAFGRLVHDEADPEVKFSPSDRESMLEALEGIHEARARLDDALLAGGPSELVELNAAVLGTVKRMLQEMDLDERMRRQLRLARRPRGARSDAPETPGPTAPEHVLEQHDPEAETLLQPPLDLRRRNP